MSTGKFSKPRPYRDEEREIEQAFRQMTGQAPETTPEPQQPIPDTFPELQLEGGEFGQTPEFPEKTGMEFPEEALPEEEPAEEPDLVDKIQAFLKKTGAFCADNRKIVMVALCVVALVSVIGFMAAFFIGTSDPYDGKILSNVYIAGVNLGGMTKDEAVRTVSAVTAGTYARQDMVVDLSGHQIRLKPEDTKVSLNVKAAVGAAYDYGRKGSKPEREQIAQAAMTTDHFIGLLPYLSLDQTYIRKVLTGYAADIGSTLTQSAYGLEGDTPNLSTADFDENVKPQTLVLTMGTPGVGFDVEAVFREILDAYSMHTFLVEAESVDAVAEPDSVDLEAIYEELYREPVNASIDMQTFETIPGSYGYGFDLEAARAMVDEAGYGQILRIPMEFIPPEIISEDVFFRDVLGSCETPHNNNKNRNTNLALACEAINGLVLNPGEAFSYNDTLGERTEKKGYKPAPSYSGLETVDSVGGGICQVSSTLYYCVLLADLNVTQRQNHGFVPSYIDIGMDATVSWGGPDFRFVNSTNYPIRIEAEVSGGYVRIKILGTDEKDYYVKMDHKITSTNEPETEYEDFPYGNSQGYENGDVIRDGVTGYYVKSYKLKYDKATNALLSKDFEANSSYVTVNKVVARVEAAPTEPPETEPPETAPPTETVPPTEPTAPPTEPTAPPTEETTPPSEETTLPPAEGGEPEE